MKQHLALSLLAVVAASALAAPPKTNLIDHSEQALISADAAKAMMAEHIPANVWKLYPANRFAFVSQVEGGVTPKGACVVTARVMLMPQASMSSALFKPQETATTFDTLPAATAAQCQSLASELLKKATTAVVSSLVKS